MAEIRIAALYMRMSTERQDYSIEHQRHALQSYAVENKIKIVKEYRDEGKSGLALKGRTGLQRLLEDVTKCDCLPFNTVLIYDISRWGRFQDIDESAYYEYVCRRQGVKVEYCFELFLNDASPMTIILKTIKRAMAAEYSRELSEKIFKAQCRFVRAGFKSGGTAGYGLRRVVVGADGRVKGALQYGDRKGGPTDRVKFEIGPDNEVAMVRRIYSMYLHDRMSQIGIAKQLNAEEVPSESGRPWNMWTVKSILTNEKYTGVLVFNKRSFKLKARIVHNTPAEWIIRDAALPAIISQEQFAMAQQERFKRRSSWTDEQLIEALRVCYKEHGVVNAKVIEANHLPSPRLYKQRFGGLVSAYALAGVPQTRYAVAGGTKHLIHAAYLALLAEVLKTIDLVGGTAKPLGRKGTLTLNGVVSLHVTAVRMRERSGQPYWRFPASATRGDFILCAQLAADNSTVIAYYLIPSETFNRPYVALRGGGGSILESCRFSSVACMFGAIEPGIPPSIFSSPK